MIGSRIGALPFWPTPAWLFSDTALVQRMKFGADAITARTDTSPSPHTHTPTPCPSRFGTAELTSYRTPEPTPIKARPNGDYIFARPSDTIAWS